MAEDGKKAEEKAASQASAASPPSAKEGVDTAGDPAAGGGGTEDEVEGEDDGEPCPKVSGTNKVDRALSASRTPYAKPQGEVEML